MSLLTAMIVASAVASAVVGGVFFAFSVFVMRALALLPPAQGVAAMQRINVTVIHPAFLGVFFGTAPLLAMTAYVGRQSTQTSAWLFAAFLIYVIGSIGVTMAFNVPRNNRLAALQATSAEATVYWATYLREWLTWNHVRCAACLFAAALAGLAGSW